MIYLVNGVWVEMGPLAPPEQVARILAEAVIPSLEMFARWEEEGRIKGGVFPGERETTFVLEADSAEEVDARMQTAQRVFYSLVHDTVILSG